MWCTKKFVFHKVIINNWSIHYIVLLDVIDIANLKHFQGDYFVKRPLLVGLILAFEHVLRNEAWHPIGVPSVVQFLVPQCLKSNNTKSGGNINLSLLQKNSSKVPSFFRQILLWCPKGCCSTLQWLWAPQTHQPFSFSSGECSTWLPKSEKQYFHFLKRSAHTLSL